MKKGFFITLEGCEGSGKTTQSGLLFEYLAKNGYRVVQTREPGGTAVAEAIRRVLLNPKNEIVPLAELLLYEAARAQHIAEVIAPALSSGAIVLCDRYTDATVAYQGYGRKIDLAVIRQLNRIASGGLVPDLTVYLDIPAATGLARARMLEKGRFTAGDRLERENISFHRKVRQGYLALARKEKKRITVIPTGKTIEQTHRRVVHTVEKALRSRGK